MKAEPSGLHSMAEPCNESLGRNNPDYPLIRISLIHMGMARLDGPHPKSGWSPSISCSNAKQVVASRSWIQGHIFRLDAERPGDVTPQSDVTSRAISAISLELLLKITQGQ